MSLRTCSRFEVLLLFMLRTTLSIDSNWTLCPDTSQWKLRAASFCDKSAPAYFCLFDYNKKVYTELCRQTSEFQRPGYEFFIRGDLDGRKCDTERYQPIALTTDGYSQCMFQKSKCNEEGQTQYDNGTTKSDRLCACDFTKSYSFVKTTGDRLFCKPTNEDCSCHKTTCPAGHTLSSDYMCTEWPTFPGTSHGPVIKGKETTSTVPDKEKQHVTTEEEIRPATESNNITELLIFWFVICLFVWIGIVFLDKSATENGSTATKKSNETATQSQPDKSATENGSTATKKSIETATQSQPDKSAAEIEITATKRSSETATPSQTDLRVYQIDAWKEEEKHIYVTSAMKHVSELLTKKTCVTVIGPPASGKSTIIHHVALQWQEKGYQLIPISSKTCMDKQLQLLESSNSDDRQIFVIDDFCGVDSVDVVAVDVWRSSYDSMKMLNENGRNRSLKMLITCRDSIYNSNQFKGLSFMTGRIYHMDKDPSTVEEKCNMLEKYIKKDNAAKVYPLLKNCNEYFPLICKMAGRIHVNDIEQLFDLQEKYIENDICRIDDEEFISVYLCVLFGEFKDDWIQKKTRPRNVDEAIQCLLSKLDKLGSRENELLKFSIGKYVKKSRNGYSLVHRVINDIVFVKCNERAKDVFLQFASSNFIATRYRFISIKEDTHNHEIEISNKKEYFQRLKKDLQNGELDSTFHNKQLKYPKYMKQLLHYINSNDDMKKTLKQLQTERILLIETAMEGYIDLIKMLISIRGKDDVNVRDTRGRTALHIAAEKGYNEIAESLLKNGAKNIKDNQNRIPEDYAQNNGNDDLVEILINHFDEG